MAEPDPTVALSNSQIDQLIRDDWARRDAHWAAHPLTHPTHNGRPLQIGDRVRMKDGYEPEGVVTEIRVRCYGDPRDEDDKRFINHVLVTVGRVPSQQIWISLNGRSGIYRPEDIVEVLADA